MMREMFREWSELVNKNLTDNEKTNIKNRYEQLFNGEVLDVKDDGTVDIKIKNTIYKRMFMSGFGASLPNQPRNCSVKFDYDYDYSIEE